MQTVRSSHIPSFDESLLMSTRTTLWTSSIGRKVLMSLTGLFLCSFLLEHLIGNFLLFIPDNGATYEAYSAFMASNFIIRTIEIGLGAAFIGHIGYGTYLWFRNKRVRPVPYEMNKREENSSTVSRVTFLTGSIVFLFLVIHLKTFFVPGRIFGDTSLTLYERVVGAFEQPLYAGFYILALVLLAYHLRHGFQSAFQTLGLRAGRFGTLVDVIGFIFWFLIPLGFATMPIYFLFFHQTGTH